MDGDGKTFEVVNPGDLVIPPSGIMSVEAWFRIDGWDGGADAHAVLFGRRNAGALTDMCTVEIHRDASTATAFLATNFFYSGASHKAKTSSAVISVGTVYHAIWTNDQAGGASSILLNGVDQSVGTTVSTTTVANSDRLYIGGNAGANSNVVGAWDEISPYGSVLSAADALALYNAGIGGGQSAALRHRLRRRRLA